MTDDTVIRNHTIGEFDGFKNQIQYPDNWDRLTKTVRERDNNRCQVVGCPSLLMLHVHHKIPLAKGGSNELDNLITLCEFHHALEHFDTNTQIGDQIHNKRFSFVKGHYRRNPFNKKRKYVKPYPRRIKCISIQDIEKLIKLYTFTCPNCKQNRIRASLNFKKKSIILKCLNCFQGWISELQLAEETGPRIAELLVLKKDHDMWETNWSALNTERNHFWKVYYFCPKCGEEMHVKKPKKNDTWSAFMSCNKYNKHIPNCCDGKREIDK